MYDRMCFGDVMMHLVKCEVLLCIWHVWLNVL